MSATVALRNIIGERQDHLVIAVVPPHRHFDPDAVTFPDHIDRVGHDGGLAAVDIANEFPDAALIEQLAPKRFGRAFVLQYNLHARIQERQFP